MSSLPEQIDSLAGEIKSLRSHPLFVMYYYETAGRISHEDVEDIYEEFRRRGWNRDTAHDDLDVLIHCYGGDANASYRVGQILHDFVKNVIFLVPYHATSGGTIVCLGGREIRLGAYAALSPIDVRLGNIELASIDSFKDFAIDRRRDVEKVLDENDSKRTTDVESVLLCEMVKQNTALGVGTLYRLKDLTGHYAFRLMYDYMFSEHSNRQVMAQKVTDSLLREFPSHSFILDYHMADITGLPVKEMSEEESAKTKALVNFLDEQVVQGTICGDIGMNEEDGEILKSPFFRLYA
jgi:hypothetical protein